MAAIGSIITAWLTKAHEFLRRDYERNQITLDIARYVGWWAHPLYYPIRTVIPYATVSRP